jgi:ATP-dependent protease HslVU (ClpYQ) peptidase subunit
VTCIVALVDSGHSYIGAERGASDVNTIFPLQYPKVWKSGPYLFGYFGSFAGERIKHNFEPPEPKIGEAIDEFMNTEFLDALHDLYEEIHIPKQEDLGLLIIIQGHIYMHNGEDMSMSHIGLPYFAEGSGMEYAMGSLYSTETLYPRERVSKALEVAIKFSPTCIGPIDVISDVE